MDTFGKLIDEDAGMSYVTAVVCKSDGSIFAASGTIAEDDAERIVAELAHRPVSHVQASQDVYTDVRLISAGESLQW